MPIVWFWESPLNPPTLGDFREFCSPQNWGARGAESYPDICLANRLVLGKPPKSPNFGGL
ncbi:hypothetical protein BJP34_12175 [Moorena producens PAL-8-15-08-1]|uniref:Uncharacterized protein n=1 Tax=Moorena producens PAL-8-15-08-1 TaxID=1458985 RepID=A0A1D8TR11_9CYAN|nr:hypothetical protein BJP34_12175 [Moorena producens PAL-8-15-08-1]